MNYTSFLSTWHAALDRAGLLLPPGRPEEGRHDRSPEKPLDAFLTRVAKALEMWREGLKRLVPVATDVN